ncbi:HlyD family secretion protein [Mangrovicoccus algicola]|uniref:HlyD family secretion protein n=1 Tax=Mangrovicoccus algicola TaxID=2771008 RepID=A0A8J6Z032_9RHOB|nr:biotin/lipoyl-binding protein [Mangrovicoccus algicola]MBE3639171.1 HlyD family secretion protein [Mangrovicoccus algicola]
MFEFMFCSMLTILPDYLFRRYRQGKRIGKEINLYSMWYELRYGITSCAVLTISLITVIFYYHPATTSVTSFYRTVTIMPETIGRVTEIMVNNFDEVEPGQPLFRIDDSRQQAAVEAARSQLAEVEASIAVGASEIAAAKGQVDAAMGALQQAQDELDTRQTLFDRGSNAVSEQDVRRMQNTVDQRQGSVGAASSNLEAVEAKVTTLLPAQRDAARAALAEAEANLARTVVSAGIKGRVEQFALAVGDVVNPMLRPAGVLVATENYGLRYAAGFDQISAQVIRPGMLTEIVCVSNPFKVIPMVVTEVQDVISAGQFRPTDSLIDVGARPPGSLTVFMEPLWPEQVAPIPPGSACMGNAYTSNHDRLAQDDVGTFEHLRLHVIDTVGIVHAAILRMQALLMPVQTLVLSGHH